MFNIYSDCIFLNMFDAVFRNTRAVFGLKSLFFRCTINGKKSEVVLVRGISKGLSKMEILI